MVAESASGSNPLIRPAWGRPRARDVRIQSITAYPPSVAIASLALRTVRPPTSPSPFPLPGARMACCGQQGSSPANGARASRRLACPCHGCSGRWRGRFGTKLFTEIDEQRRARRRLEPRLYPPRAPALPRARPTSRLKTPRTSMRARACAGPVRRSALTTRARRHRLPADHRRGAPGRCYALGARRQPSRTPPGRVRAWNRAIERGAARWNHTTLGVQGLCGSWGGCPGTRSGTSPRERTRSAPRSARRVHACAGRS